MSESRLEQNELQKGYTYIETICAIMGQDTLNKVVIKGGKHPRMRLLVSDVNTALNTGEGFSEDWSYVVALAACTSGVIDVRKRDGTIAGRTGAINAISEISPFVAIAPSATQNVSQVFEADEDVMIEPGTTLGAAGASALAILKFEVLE